MLSRLLMIPPSKDHGSLIKLSKSMPIMFAFTKFEKTGVLDETCFIDHEDIFFQRYYLGDIDF